MIQPVNKKRPTVGLGIDVGGTYSDSILVDLTSGSILSKAKSPTTHQDLVKGILGSLALLDKSLFPSVQLVSLSTTLATNALVEGRRSRVNAILVGYKRNQCPQEFVNDICLLKGGHTAEGEEMAPLDLASAERFVEFTRSRVEAYAVSSYFSTRNPSHETAVRDLIHRLAPDRPVACGHELSYQLDAKLRATTTILNAHLIPLVRGLLLSVKQVLQRYDIHAPLMIVKGDGSLFKDDLCMARPVETILSGPAASVVGAGYLMGERSGKAVVMDIGGTTSDIAVLESGHPRLNPNGVTVGPWRTHVSAIDVRTVGLGGDSHIRITDKGEVLIGPKRVEPLCMLARRFPGVSDKTHRIPAASNQDHRFTPYAFWFRTEKTLPEDLSSKGKDILGCLSQGPLNIFEIARKMETYPIGLSEELRRLEEQSLLGLAGFTLTDAFHIRSLYIQGDRDFSLLAAGYLAGQLGTNVESFLLEVDEVFRRNISLEIIDSLTGGFPISYSAREKTCPACQQIWKSSFWERGSRERQTRFDLFHFRFALDVPLIGIGAPAHVLVPPLAQRLETEVHIPEHAEVANALGAIVGTILIKERVLLRPVDGGVACFTSSGKSVYKSFEEAKREAHVFLTEHLESAAKRAGGNGVELDIREVRKEAPLASGEQIIIEVVIHGQAVAKPSFKARPGGPNCLP